MRRLKKLEEKGIIVRKVLLKKFNKKENRFEKGKFSLSNGI